MIVAIETVWEYRDKKNCPAKAFFNLLICEIHPFIHNLKKKEISKQIFEICLIDDDGNFWPHNMYGAFELPGYIINECSCLAALMFSVLHYN